MCRTVVLLLCLAVVALGADNDTSTTTPSTPTTPTTTTTTTTTTTLKPPTTPSTPTREPNIFGSVFHLLTEPIRAVFNICKEKEEILDDFLGLFTRS